MTACSPATEAQIAESISQTPWQVRDGVLCRTVVAPSFAGVIEMVNAVAALSQRRDHHPEMIISGCRLTMTLTTHDVAAITQLDLAMVPQIDAIVDEFLRVPLST